MSEESKEFEKATKRLRDEILRSRCEVDGPNNIPQAMAHKLLESAVAANTIEELQQVVIELVFCVGAGNGAFKIVEEEKKSQQKGGEK